MPSRHHLAQLLLDGSGYLHQTTDDGNQGSRCIRRRRTKENQRNQEQKRDQEEVKEERITGKEERRLEDAQEGKNVTVFALSLIFFYLFI